MEDENRCLSSWYLREDGTAILGRTDGPVPDECAAEWAFDENDETLTLSISRLFDKDRVPFTVQRILRGSLDREKHIGTLLLFEGAIFFADSDFDPASALGHFAFVAASDEAVTENVFAEAAKRREERERQQQN